SLSRPANPPGEPNPSRSADFVASALAEPFADVREHRYSAPRRASAPMPLLTPSTLAECPARSQAPSSGYPSSPSSLLSAAPVGTFFRVPSARKLPRPLQA